MVYDVTLAGGRVVDTDHKTSRIANVAINGSKIAAVSTDPLPAKRTIDVSGNIVAPGFIDAHAHLDGYDYGGRLSVLQGITTTVGGNCRPLIWPLFLTSSRPKDLCSTK
ncbi:MAG: amidohydrolase family protein [Ruthenibacterium sp.]